jgi:NAD(P)-dependent dehydrogenase (short-subunit alcohol dehydrogenase family)
MSVLDRFRLNDKRALITGGSRGLGREMALALAEAGADLVIVGREEPSLKSVAGELARFGHRVDTIVGDVSTPDEAARVSELAIREFGPVDILINNVGGRRINIPTESMPIDEWQRIMDLNLTSAFVCTKIVGGEMIKRRWGRIINTASICALIATRGIAGRSYETAKAAVCGFTRAVAVDWAPYNVTVNAIAAGGFLTDPNLRWYEQMPELKNVFESQVPMGRLGEPSEIGPLALYLASDASSYMTGSVVVIDGGYTAW